MIKLVDLTKIYNTGESVGIGIQGINLEFKVGEFVAIVGSSGSGKTTLLNIISGMDTYTEGEMFINNISTANFDVEELENYRRANVAFIFQNYHLIDSYTVLENVMVELMIKGLSKKEAKQKAIELITKVGMKHRLNNRATKLSGGEKQRVVIARALASDAKILACDEPTGNLDEKNTLEIMSLIKEVATDKLVLFVTHDESTIANNATRIIKIRDGKVESDTELIKTEKIDFEMSVPTKNNFNTKMYISSRNMIRTPKKTFFVSMIFLIVSFILLFSIAYIPLNVVATDKTIIEFTMFNNRDENRIVVYPNNNFDGNYNVENTMIFEDDYLLDYNFKANTTSYTLNKYFYETSKIIFIDDEIELISGRLPENEYEVFVILDDSFSAEFCDQLVDEKLSLRFALDKKTESAFGSFFNIVGFGTIDEIEKETSYFYFNEDGLHNFYNGLKAKIVSNKDYKNFEADFSLLYKDKSYPVRVNTGLSPEEIKINFVYKDKDYKLFLGSKEIDLNNYNYNYTYDTKNDYHIEISYEMALQMIKDSKYRVSIIAHNDNLNTVIDTLKQNENLDVFPLIEARKEIDKYNYQSIFKNLFSLVFVLIEIVVSIFITALITTLILGTKKKEIGVLRVIGLNKKDILHILFLEVVTIMIISICINISTAIILKYIIPNFFYSIILNNLLKLFTTIFILIIMSVYIAYRWNKSIFKLTAREVLRAGE